MQPDVSRVKIKGMSRHRSIPRWRKTLPALLVALAVTGLAALTVLVPRLAAKPAADTSTHTPSAPTSQASRAVFHPVLAPPVIQKAPAPRKAAPKTKPKPMRIDPCQAPRHLTAMSFNMKSARAGSIAGIAAAIRSAGPDVVLLQEVDDDRAKTGHVDQAAALGSATGMAHYFGSNVVYRGGGRYGTAILTRYPVTSWGNTHLPNRGNMEQRGLLRVTMTVEGQKLTVFDTHLQNTSASMRLTQINAIRPMVSAADGAILLGGDLNSTPTTPVLGVARTFLTDSWPAVGSGGGGTVGGARIDYLLHNAWLTPTKAYVQHNDVSDHDAVVTDFDLYGASDC